MPVKRGMPTMIRKTKGRERSLGGGVLLLLATGRGVKNYRGQVKTRKGKERIACRMKPAWWGGVLPARAGWRGVGLEGSLASKHEPSHTLGGLGRSAGGE